MAALSILLTLFAAAGSATVTLSTEATNTTVHPGSNGTVANYALHVQNDSVQLTDIYINRFPFNAVDFSPANTSVTARCSQQNNTTECPVVNRTITATVMVPDGWRPGTFTGNAVFVFANRSAQTRPLSVTVPTVRNWTVNGAATGFRPTLDLGTEGDLGNLTASNQGNVKVDLAVNATGNVTRLYDDLPTTVSTNPGRNRTVTVQYQLPANTPFGVYTGNITLIGPANTSRTVPVRVRAEDTIRPQFNQPLQMDDIMATTDRSLALVLKDNLAVAGANVTVLREKTIQQRNRTIPVNETVTTYTLERQAEYSDIWRFTYDATDTRGQYYLNMTVRDTAGNTVSQLDAFQVTTLDAVQVTDTNMLLDGIRFDEEVSQPILENTVDSEFTVRLQSFDYGGNKTPEAGILAPGGSTAEMFAEDRQTLTFSETGEYKLVVKAQGREAQSRSFEYQGRLGIQVPRQHQNISNITFRGPIDNNNYPVGKFLSLREFDGYIGYNNALEKFETRYGEIGVGPSKQFVYFIGRVNASQCRGADGWFPCMGLTLGEYREIEEELEMANTKLQNVRSQLWLERLLTLFGAYTFWRFYKHRKLLRLYLPRKHADHV